MPATAGSDRKTAEPGARTGSAATRRPSSTSTSTTSTRRSTSFAAPMRRTVAQGRYRYTMTFPKDDLPPIDRNRGGFWSLTMYDKDYYMWPDSPNKRTNIGTVSLDANELKFDADGSLTLHLRPGPHRRGRKGKLAAHPQRSVRVDRAHLCTNGTVAQGRLQAAKRAARVRSIYSARIRMRGALGSGSAQAASAVVHSGRHEQAKELAVDRKALSRNRVTVRAADDSFRAASS